MRKKKVIPNLVVISRFRVVLKEHDFQDRTFIESHFHFCVYYGILPSIIVPVRAAALR